MILRYLKYVIKVYYFSNVIKYDILSKHNLFVYLTEASPPPVLADHINKLLWMEQNKIKVK